MRHRRPPRRAGVKGKLKMLRTATTAELVRYYSSLATSQEVMWCQCLTTREMKTPDANS